MPQTIRIRRSTTASAVPTSLLTGEIAINEADGILYYRNSSGSVTRFAGGAKSVVTYASQTLAQLAGSTVLSAGSASPVTVTVPTNASVPVPVGASIDWIQTGAMQLRFTAAAGVNLFGARGLSTRAQFSCVTLTKTDTNTWVLSGDATETAISAFASDSLYGAAQIMAAQLTASTPTAGSDMTINGLAVGPYDYVIKQGSQTISTFTAADWFTTTQDTRSAWIVVKGDLTINSGQIVIPTVRKLFVVVYVTGNLTLNGSISMSLRGANHSGTGSSGGATTAQAIRIATGTFSGFSNPTIPAAGGNGGAARVSSNGVGNNGTGAGQFGTGGGGGGAYYAGSASSFASGAGAAGTCFSGGSGGGGLSAATPTASAGSAVANGGAAGQGAGAGGGVGNPSGSVVYGTTDTGTGGTVIVICENSVTGSGSVRANGGNNNEPWLSPAPYSGVAGGASGGGSVVLLARSASGPTLSATGGTSTGGTASGGQGGTGSTATLIIP